MSIQVASINLSTAIVGTAGTIPLSQATPPPTLQQQMRPLQAEGPNLFVWNESGCGLTCLWPLSRETFTLPAGQWRLLKVPPGEEQLFYQVTYVIPNANVSLLLADLYHPGEPLDPMGVLGNSPVAVGGTVSTASSNIVYNVTDPTYGAKGDGANDDTSAIQAAISAAQAVGGGIIFFPDGTYKITGTLLISHDNVELVGAGWGAILSWAGAAAGTMVQVQAPGGVGNFRYGIKISDLFLTGNSVAGVNALDLQSCYGLLVDHVRIRFCNGICIHDDGIGGAFGAYNHVRNCHISDSTGTGLRTDNSEWLEVTGTHFGGINNAGAAVAVQINNLNCQIHHNQFDHNDIAIDLEFAGRTHIEGNQFDRGATNYIKIRGAQFCVVAHNFFGQDNQTTGVDMIAITDAGSHANVVSDNNAASGGAWTNFCHETVAVTAVGNYVHGNMPGGYGISLTAGVSYAFDNSEAIATDGAGGMTIRNGQTVATIRSAGGGAAGVTVWVGTTDPAGAAAEGDVWLPV